MKKFLALMLAVLLLTSMVACTANTPAAPTDTAQTSEPATDAPAAETAAEAPAETESAEDDGPIVIGFLAGPPARMPCTVLFPSS